VEKTFDTFAASFEASQSLSYRAKDLVAAKNPGGPTPDSPPNGRLESSTSAAGRGCAGHCFRHVRGGLIRRRPVCGMLATQRKESTPNCSNAELTECLRDGTKAFDVIVSGRHAECIR